MYVPKHFEEQDAGRLRSLIRQYPLGALVTATASGLDANHIPFLFTDTASGAGTLHGHIARANPLWREAMPDAAVLVIFQGPDSFISPSWYPSKRQNPRVVPTWNYAVVHAHGILRVVDDPAWVRSHVEALTREHEGTRAAPWAVTDAPADFIDTLVAAVVGIEISITRLVGKWKVSQNRSISDRVGVVEALELEAAPSRNTMAELIQEAMAPSPPAKFSPS